MSHMNKFPLMTKCLQGLKGLTETEALAYFKLCSKSHFSANDVKTVLNEVGDTKKSRSSAYSVVDKFEREGLIFLYENSQKKQTYKALHPRSLLDELKNNLKGIEPEIQELEESYETSDFQSKDPRDSARTLKIESEITTMCNTLHKDCEITFVHNSDIVISTFVEKFSTWNNTKKGKTNVILFNNKKTKDKGIIRLAKRPSEGGQFRIYGQMIVDEDTYNYYFVNEVKK